MKKIVYLCYALIMSLVISVTPTMAGNVNPLPGFNDSTKGFNYTPAYTLYSNCYATVGNGNDVSSKRIGYGYSHMTRARSNSAIYGSGREYNNVIICYTELQALAIKYKNETYTGMLASCSLSVPKLSYHTIGFYSPEPVTPTMSVSDTLSVSLGGAGFKCSATVNSGKSRSATLHAVSISSNSVGGRFIKYSFDYKNFEDFCLNNYIAKYMVSYTSRMQGATNTDACRRIAVSVSFAVKCSSPYGVCYKSPISGTSCFGMANY